MLYRFNYLDTSPNIGGKYKYIDTSMSLLSSVSPFGWAITAVVLVISIIPSLTVGVDQIPIETGRSVIIYGIENIPSEYISVVTNTVCEKVHITTDVFSTSSQCYATFQSITTLPPSTVTETSTITSVITEGAKAYGNLTMPYTYIGVGGGSLVVSFLVALKAAAIAGVQGPFFAVFLGVFVALGVSLSSSFFFEGIIALMH